MHWQDEGYLLFKSNYSENSIIIESFTRNHGKYSGIVYGGSSSKNKKIFQIGNKILLNWKSKNENKTGYFNIELIEPISPKYFDNKKRISCILSAITILKILLPERQINRKIYKSFENLLNNINNENWITSYIYWELFLIKELGFDIDLTNEIKKNSKKNIIKINNKSFKIPSLFYGKNLNEIKKNEIKEALIFNKNILIESFILPNQLRFPVSRNLLENYYS